MRKKAKTTLIVILLILLALFFAIILMALIGQEKRKVLYKQTKSAPASFDKTAKKVIDIVSDNQEEFMNSAPEERKKIAEKILDDLIAEGVLNEKNICFDSDNNVYQFVTNDGAINLITLNDIDPAYMGAMNIESETENETEGSDGSQNRFVESEGYQYFPNGQPYTAEEFIAEDLDMLFLTEIQKITNIDSINDYFGYHEFFINHTFEACNQAHVKYQEKPETTVEEMKTCLKGYDYVSLDFHGAIYDEFKSSSWLLDVLNPFVSKVIVDNGFAKLDSFLKDQYGEENTTLLLLPENVAIEADMRYKDDLYAGRIGRNLMNFGYTYLLTPLFFYDYYKEDGLKGTIVYIGACDGYRNETLPATFKLCGAEAVVAYDHSVSIPYCVKMEWRFLHWLLYGGTVGESVSFAQRLEGDQDSVEPHARLKIYRGDEDVVLMKNTVLHKNYVLIDKSMSYEDAVKFCKEHGGKIATVRYPAEQRALNEVLQSAEKNCYWIGLKKTNGTYRWEGDGSELGYHQRWANGEPTNDGTGIMVYGRPNEEIGSKVGEWNDVSYASSLQTGFYAADQFGVVCELNAGESLAIEISEETDDKTEQKSDDKTEQDSDDQNTPDTTGNIAKWVRTKETCYEYDWYFTDGKFNYSMEYEYDTSGKCTKMTSYVVSWKNDIVSDYYHEYVYDMSGNMISDTCYSPDGNKYYWHDFEYDEKGLMTKKIYHFQVKSKYGEPYGNTYSASEYVFKYDENGRLTKESHYDTYGKIDDWSEKEYDLAGNMIKDTEYKGNGSLERYSTFEYDERGKLLKETFYDSDGKLYSSNKHEYDAQGNLYKSEHYNTDYVMVEFELYEYDSSGNKTKHTEYYADGTIMFWEEYEYDDNGNNTKFKCYGSEGNITKRYEYEYKFIPGENE